MKKALLVFLSSLVVGQAKAYLRCESYISKIYQDDNGHATGCYQIFTLITDVGDDGWVTYVSSGFSNVGTNCPQGSPTSPNPNFPPYVCNDITFTTQREAQKDLGQTLCENEELFASYLEFIEGVISKGGNRNANGGFGATNTMKNSDNISDKAFLAYPSPSKATELTVRINHRAIAGQPATLELTDATGRLVRSVQVHATSDSQMISLPTTPGTYNVTLRSAGRILHSQRVIKQ